MTELTAEMTFAGTVAGRFATATFSVPDRKYRYALTREWDRGIRTMTFIMLNPSDADEERDDATVRRCAGFAVREGCGRLLVVNLFALVSRNPSRLLDDPGPVGPVNDTHIRNALAMWQWTGGPVVAAWGVVHPRLRPRVRHVLSLAEDADATLLSLGGLTAGGHPRHPLFLPSDAPLRNVSVELCTGAYGE